MDDQGGPAVSGPPSSVPGRPGSARPLPGVWAGASGGGTLSQNVRRGAENVRRGAEFVPATLVTPRTLRRHGRSQQPSTTHLFRLEGKDTHGLSHQEAPQ